MKKKDMLIVQGDWNAKIGKDSINDWSDYCGTACNTATNDRGLRLSNYNDLIVANTLGKHKQSRISKGHSPNGKIHNQIDYILIKIRFIPGINVAKTRIYIVYNKADIGSDHDLVMMSFKQKLKSQR